jgi:hypothetical protein
MLTMRVLTACLLTLAAVPAAAQEAAARPRPARAFFAVNAEAQAGAADLTDRILFDVNTETATIESRYPGRTGLLIDGGAGLLVWRRLGVAVAFSRGASSASASVAADIPHPFFDDRHRHVEGVASSLNRTEMAAHAQLYYELPMTGRWRARIFAGPSYFHVDQEVVSDVRAVETYPYDSAEFGSATTGRAKGSGVGFNAGADLAWMFTRRIGAGVLLRYAGASLDLNAPASRTVSSDGGGFQGGGGLRILF